MASYDHLVERLPSLWRPQRDDATLLVQLLRAVGSGFDGAAADIQHVLRARWFDTADAAAWAQHFAADRRERGLGALRLGNIGDQREALSYPYVRDLARLGALLDLPPWRDPASLREGVEEYRQRVGDVLAAYRDGLVTPAALRKLVDAALPELMDRPLAAQRGRCAIEEPAAVRFSTLPLVATPTVQEGERVAALSRWAIDMPGTPGFVLQGVAADSIGGTTDQPMVERYTPAAAVKGVGVAYIGTLAPGQALRFAPARRQWLLRGAELLASTEETASNAARDPSVNGPFATVATAAGSAAAVAGAPDGSVWLIVRGDVAQQVCRFDGTTLTTVDTDAPAGPFNALASCGDSAWLGTDAGLFRCPLWPDDGVLRWQAIAGVTGAIRVLTGAPAETVIAAGAQGVWQIDRSGAMLLQRFANLDLVGYANDGTRELLATSNALFLARQGQVWRYDAQGPSEELPDWADAPAPDNTQKSPLPSVTCIATSRDDSLWLGGPSGLARWYAAENGTTRLAAFPDIFAGAVHQLTVDDRGMLWIAGDDGLFMFDGRDLAQFDIAAASWTSLGDAELSFPEALRSEARGFWRFDRANATWQRFDAAAARFTDSALPARAAPSDAIAGLAMLPSLRAELGSFDGGRFSAGTDVAATDLRLRIKPDETRCIDGALPYLPANDVAGTWRYLQMDTAPAPPTVRPWWSTEGQLFVPPLRDAPVPGHRRDAAAFLADAQHEGQFDRSVFVYPPSAKLWITQAAAPAVGIRVRLFLADPAKAVDPALADRVWQLIARARPAGVPLQLMAEGSVIKESSS